MAFIKHRGTFEITVEVSADETYTLLATIPREPDFSRTLTELAHPVDGSEPVIRGWSGVADTDTGEALPMTAENCREVFADALIEGAVWRALGKLRGEALSGELARKNLPKPAATGPEAAAESTAAG